MGLGSDPRSGNRKKTYSGSRIQGSKRHRIPDPDPQHWLVQSFNSNSWFKPSILRDYETVFKGALAEFFLHSSSLHE
jgi:hypothetical protein